MLQNDKLHKTVETEANDIPDFTLRTVIGSVNLFAGTGRQSERLDALKAIIKYATQVEQKPNAQPGCATFVYRIFNGEFELEFEVIEWTDQVDRQHSTYKIYRPTHQILEFIEEKIGFNMPITKIDFVYEMTTSEPEALFELIAPSIFLKWRYRVKEGFTFKTAIQTNTNMVPKVSLHAIARKSAFRYLKVTNLADLPSVSPSHVASYLSFRRLDVPAFKASVLRNAQSKEAVEIRLQGVLSKIRETSILKGVNETERYLEERQISGSFVRHPINKTFQDAVSTLRFMRKLEPLQTGLPDELGDSAAVTATTYT